ncbi:MAG: hypothetical protein FJ387_19295 [Verrucomicrobia bacterium]|nr:hypothetical protein [Verrucomicrobiota bacterium]
MPKGSSSTAAQSPPAQPEIASRPASASASTPAGWPLPPAPAAPPGPPAPPAPTPPAAPAPPRVLQHSSGQKSHSHWSMKAAKIPPPPPERPRVVLSSSGERRRHPGGTAEAGTKKRPLVSALSTSGRKCRSPQSGS